MFWSFPQIVGYIAFSFGVLAFLQKVDLRLKFFSALECAILAAHFYLLDNQTAAFLVLLSSFRNIAAIYTRSLWVAGFFLILGVSGGLYTAQYWFSFLVIIAQIVSTSALFTCQGIKLRFAFLFASSCWLVNNILTGSIGGIALETFIILANITTIRRLNKENLKEKTAN